MSVAMDIETLAGHLNLARKLASDIDYIVERRRAAWALLEREGSDPSKALHLLNVSEDSGGRFGATKSSSKRNSKNC